MTTRGRGLGSRRICQGQRLRIHEVSQVCIDAGYDHLCLPMRAYTDSEMSPAGDKSESGEPAPVVSRGKPKPTAIGWTDPRKPGELLFPEFLPESAVSAMQGEMTPFDAAAQLQQRPVRIMAGGLFPRSKVSWIEPEAVPWSQIDRAIRFWDKAGGESVDADYSAGVLIGRWRRGDFIKLIVIHAVIGKWNPFERDEIIEATCESDWKIYPAKKVEPVIEKESRGGAGIQSAQISARDLARFGVRFESPSESKLIRAKPFSSVWHAGDVIMVVGTWNSIYLDQLEAFTGEDRSKEGIHDDCVDGSSGAAGLLLNAPRSTGGKPVGLPGRRK